MPADYIIRPLTSDHVTCAPSYLPLNEKRVTTIIHKNYEPDPSSEWSLVDQLRRLKKNISCNRLKMVWSRDTRGSKVSKNCDRAMAKGNLSMGDTKREVRHGLVGDAVVDFDQCGSHQSLILCALVADPAVNTDTEYPHLTEYVQNKITERKRLADTHFGGNIHQAKQMYQKVTFGGKVTVKDPQLLGFSREMADFRTRIRDANPTFHSEIKRKTTQKNKGDNWEVSLMSLWCRNKESELIEAVVGWAIEDGLIKNRTFDNSKDGLMIPIADVESYLTNNPNDHESIDDICAHFEEVGADVTGYRVSWDQKPLLGSHEAFWNKMDSISVTMPAAPADGSGMKFDQDYVDSLPTTDAKLAYFNLLFAFIRSQSKVFHLQAIDVTNADGTTERKRETVYYNQKDFCTTFGNIDSGQKTAMGSPISLPTLWLQYSNRRTYATTANHPYPDVYNPSRAEYYSKDVYNQFEGYPQIVWENARPDEFTEDEMRRLIRPFIQLTSHLIGCKCHNAKGVFPDSIEDYPPTDRTKLELVLMLVGIRVAHPDWEREPYALLIQGMQGTGKNTFTNVIARLIGSAHYKCSANIDDFLGTHAESLERALVAVFNEAQIADTAKHASKVKSLVTEDKAIANPKNIRPYEFTVAALFIALSNDVVPIKIDVMNGDRRWIVMKSNEWCPKRYTRDIWTKLQERFKQPIFLRALRQFFTNQDYASYNFREAKIANTRTPEYQNLVQYMVPAEARFVQNFIEQQQYNPGTFNPEVPTEPTPFHTNAMWDSQVSVLASEFFATSKTFFENVCISGAVAEKSLQSFNNKINSLNLFTKTTGKRGQVTWQFTPREVYASFVDQGFIATECVDEATLVALAATGGGQVEEVIAAADIGIDW